MLPLFRPQHLHPRFRPRPRGVDRGPPLPQLLRRQGNEGDVMGRQVVDEPDPRQEATDVAGADAERGGVGQGEGD